jgi:hypothetical protein
MVTPGAQLGKYQRRIKQKCRLAVAMWLAGSHEHNGLPAATEVGLNLGAR